MTSRSHPDAGTFRLSILINDTRYRSITFQIIALFLLCLAFGYLISNLLTNLRAAGLNISYDFLVEPAGYDINQRPIEYPSQIKDKFFELSIRHRKNFVDWIGKVSFPFVQLMQRPKPLH